MIDELKVKLWHIGNVVLMKVLQQPYDTISGGVLYEQEYCLGGEVIDDEPNILTFKLVSTNKPFLDANTVGVLGDEIYFNEHVAHISFDTEVEAHEYIGKIQRIIAEFNDIYSSKIKDDDLDIAEKCNELRIYEIGRTVNIIND